MDEVRILQVIFVIVILGVIVYLLRLSYSLKLEKRIAKFAIMSIKDDEVSFLDKFIYYWWWLLKKISKIFSKSYLINKYGEKYSKFIAFNDKEKKDGVDYISFKFLLASIICIISLSHFVLRGLNIDVMIILIVFLITFFIPDIFWNIEFAKKRKKIENDLLKAIIVMNSAFQSGRNIMQAVECVKEELDGPIQDEFKKIYLDITYGLNLDVVFGRFYERVKLDDAKYISSSLILVNKTGGDIVKVFGMIERSIFDRKNLKNELKSLTASSRFVFRLLVFLPFVFALIIFVLNPLYFMPLFKSLFGVCILLIIISLYIFYIVIIRKVLEVKI